MTSSSSLFSNYSRCYKNERVRIADGSFSPIVGKCQIEISNQITLQSVLHVTKLACNLLSVSKISKDSNCRVVFLDSHCEFQDWNSGKMIGSAKMVHGLYYFVSNPFENKIAQGYGGSVSSISAHEKIMLWHLRLGHPNFPYLKRLFPKLFQYLDCYSLHCESCYLSKSNKVNYLTNHIMLPNYFI